MIIDTHSHIYDEAFDQDRETVLGRAVEAGVGHILLPAVDKESYARMFELAASRPDMCTAMMGLHPTSVNDNPSYADDLELVMKYLSAPPQGVVFCGVGEIGLDLYWSRDFLREQLEALHFQIKLALEHDMPVVMHTRDAWNEMCGALGEYKGSGLKGVMHSFSGTIEHYRYIKSVGEFCFGIGGPITYKRSLLAEILPLMDIKDIVIETDSPYLPPVPYRGKRNESGYAPIICGKIAEIFGIEEVEAADITTANAQRIFRPFISGANENAC